MKNLLIITPVKDSVVTAIEAVTRICQSKGDHPFKVYNDFSLPESRTVLEHGSILGYQLVNIEDHVKTPSPNYRYTLIDARKQAIDMDAHLLIVESDVYVNPDTINRLLSLVEKENKCGLVAAVTTDESGQINFPYSHLPKDSTGVIATRHRVSFCCTILSNELLRTIDFTNLPSDKDWYDVQISKLARKKGFRNLIDTSNKVVHYPHSSRPWKQLKYEHPVKYYFRKLFNRMDKI